jgi:leucyl-tRNA synthetase
MELLNTINKHKDVIDEKTIIIQEALESIVMLLSPITPHICHALWKKLGHETSIIYAKWPIVDESVLVKKEIQLIIQVNGKLRSKMIVDVDTSKTTIEKMVMEDEKVKNFIGSKLIKKIIYVKDKLVNVVI